ncbi:substrate-binding domain-containing protein [Serratia ficaria]|uniref:substrate-binding domain-containing protein n=1 Tax=Serratia ficaria TaxID=61651 RepID=UPI00077CCD1D|nr:substrate-binding domain-containing protein [Serratia ficaria]CAI0817209.1 molybdate ABC transporter periplasmic molybdate-binding protein [Serratia ficaria]CAI0863491.1 molybdate ABC transporter periplasmic molybdate-binding protein [Serratia ficaria]CAI1538440.1 molybdate ABC transporter periplasmic molybdate-binding protein [Serratia ficaria]CAI1581842.1 molybdate ABC transporter periplasmic molybdate-binding protein [Serratia ficaria]CAI2137157.1 molybdate ABC transporter periplasmic mo
MTDILLYAAGSLRLAFAPLLAAFQAQSGAAVEAVFAPAGLLCRRIENGERPQLFASANLAHPQRLAALGMAQPVTVFARNRLCATVRNIPPLTERPLAETLCDPRWRLATSTPGADPSGDYAQQLFERIERREPGQGEALRLRALALVGGEHSAPIPSGRLAAEYLIDSGLADIFLGYASYAPALAAYPALAVRQFEPPLAVMADYGLCLLDARAQRLADFILAEQGQEILRRNGFLPP